MALDQLAQWAGVAILMDGAINYHLPARAASIISCDRQL